MQAYDNSPVREGIRKRNLSAAEREAAGIQAKLESDLRCITDERGIPIDRFYPVAGVTFFIVLFATKFDLGASLILGIGAGLGAWVFMNKRIRDKNNENERMRQQLRRDASAATSAAYSRADQLTRQQVDAYDGRVKQFRRACNATNLSRMADYCASVFMEGLAEAETKASNYSQFVQYDFTYNVTLTDIDFMFDGEPVEDRSFDFLQQRYKNLNDTSEAEGLAAVLMKTILAKLKPRFAGKYAKVTNNHRDALVTIHFSMPNRNFVPATSYTS